MFRQRVTRACRIADVTILTDVLQDGLSVVFCGTAVGPTAAMVRAYYARPRNQFWNVLYEIGLTPRRLQPQEYVTLTEFGIGLTDLVKVTSGT